ncbi:hypothetical protein B0A55_06115 [Friedmanniomyces simplex]|uniref:RING-type domain-containing protein n=1 Tax=Friedmanniomyces simplex TaxID=329884 RepID=A0A4U0X527_9PEZI|nr:hypothetical protein B0A55_06115 [Friedmanniomyces simplex]
MRPLRFLLTLLTCVFAFFCLLFIGPWRASATEDLEERSTIGAFFNWRTPSSLFPPSAIISLTDDNSTFFLARPAAFGPLLPSKSLSGQLWIGSGFGDDHLGRGGAGGGAEGELGCSDIPDWDDDGYRSNNGKGRQGGDAKTAAADLPDSNGKSKRSVEMEAVADEAELGEDPTEDDGTDDHLHHPLPPSDGLKTNGEPAGNTKKPTHADIQSLQETAEIAGKVVLLSRGGCGFLEKVKWVQRRGGVALIVGDDLRGGPLVTMYAHGDTSNVTIPALFTSHMTAHLLSSLIPSGGLVEELSAEDAARLGLALGDKGLAGKGSKQGAGAEKPNFTTTSAAAKATATSKAAHPKDEVAADEDGVEEQSREAVGWFRSLFSRGGNAGRPDSRRPPSSGNLGWLQQKDFEDFADDSGVIGRKAVTSSSSTSTTKKTSSTGKGDGFVIGVQDWRDPDMVADEKERQQASTSGVTSTSLAAQSSGPPKHVGLYGGSITPGSGEYVKASHEVASLPGSERQASTDVAGGKHSRIEQPMSGNWFTRLFHPRNKHEKPNATPKTAAKASEPVSQPPHPEGFHPHHQIMDRPPQHDGLWVTLTPTSMSSSPFFDTLLVLVVSPLVTLTVVYALLLLRSRIRRRRWRAPKSVVERLPVRTYQTMPSSATSSSTSALSSPVSATTPLLPTGARPINARSRPRSRTASEVPVQASSSLTDELAPPSLEQIEEKRAAGLAEWRRRYGGKQRECVVCLEEYVDGVSRVMSLPCGHEFHAECITPWLTTRRRTCPICKGDVVRSLARSTNTTTASTSPPALPPPPAQRYHDDPTEDNAEEDVQEQAATARNDDPAAALPVSREDEAFEDLERGIGASEGAIRQPNSQQGLGVTATMATPRPLSFDREFAAAAAAMAEAGAAMPQLAAGDVDGRRKFFEQYFSSRSSMVPSTPSVAQKKHQIKADDGSTIVLTEFRPNSAASTASPALYYTHGGGMILGSVAGFAAGIAIKAEAAGVPIFAVGYRLAPEYPHPIPVNDCYAGLTWLHSHAAELGVDNSRIMIYGESAGGGLAAGVALMARDRKLDPPLAFQMLIYPMLDDRNLKPIAAIEPYAMWKCNDNITGWSALLGKAAGSDEEVDGHEFAAPARAKSVKDLPPTYIDVGGLDLFVSEDCSYAARLVEAGVQVELHVHPGLPHGFELTGAQTSIVKGVMANRQRVYDEFKRGLSRPNCYRAVANTDALIPMDNADLVNALLKQLDAQKDAYQETFRQVHELFAQNIAATVSPASKVPTTPSLPPQSPRQSVSGNTERANRARKVSTGLATLTTSSESKRTGDDSDADDDESLYVSGTLEPELYTEESLRKHLQSYKWNPYGAKILETVIDSPPRLLQTPLVTRRKGPVDDRSHLSHYQVFDVGPDGAPMNQPPKERLAVGRITILREPSPMLFGAVHHTLSKHFDVDELFRHLIDSEGSSANMHRAFEEDLRKQKSFVFNFEYFTIIGKGCKPMKWQLADRQEERSASHIPITRCSSVVALVLEGPAVKKVKNPSRQATNSHGFAYDPWSSWQVLNLQCYPDWHASLDVHDSTRHYVNGPEAFLATVLGELMDAQKRLEPVYQSITKLIMPPLDFMFDSAIRDKLLFEDKDFTYSRRYFWAYQTLGLMNDSIRAMIDAVEDTFTEQVWSGTHKTLWPLLEQDSARNVYFRKRMASLRGKFEIEIKNLRKQIDENDERRREIRGLREELFTGTSVQESRKSIENTEITIQQGHNIRLLTLVSIFFLPLTFVTSVFGMTNMPTERHYWTFGIVTVTVCVPFFVLLGSLNTTRGMRFWRVKTVQLLQRIGDLFSWLCRGGRPRRPASSEAVLGEEDPGAGALQMSRSTSTQNARNTRLRRWSSTENERISKVSLDTAQSTRQDTGIVRPAMVASQSSTLAELWMSERKRTLRYSLDV